MKMQRKKTALALVLLSTAALLLGLRQPAAIPPNIVLIMADDLGYGDLGAYGQTKINTPYLDELATSGMRFTSFYSGSTVCAPSRSALLTGQHTGHTPIRGNVELPEEGQAPLPSSAFTLAEMLQQAGYVTGAFGKWGLGGPGTEGVPNNQGFNVFFGYNCQREAHRQYPEHLWHNGRKVPLPGNFSQPTYYAPDLIHQRALEFIDNNKDRHFFLYYPSTLPHAELMIPPGERFSQYQGKFEEIPFVNKAKGANYGEADLIPAHYNSQPAPRAAYAAMVSLLDRQVGEVVAKLKALGLDKNTLIIFTSDNGPHLEGGGDPDFFDSNGPWRGFKRDLYEGGIRVPFIACWPGKIKAGSVSHHVAAGWDLMPTLAEVAGLPLPRGTDGLSFLSALLQGKQLVHQYLYWEFREGDNYRKALRHGDWKALEFREKARDYPVRELYKIKSDSTESNDLAALHPGLLDSLVSLMALASGTER
jgi:arylsulfatase A-like enzyme